MANMETSMYDDNTSGAGKDNFLKTMKRKMTLPLDLNSPFGTLSKHAKFSALLASPDLNMLKLASPELEKMIIQSNGMVTTTPTPTQFICPKSVTEEQEAYARGFVDALAELHKQTESCDSFVTNSISSAMTTINGDTGCSTTSLLPLTVMSVPQPTTMTIDTKAISMPTGVIRQHTSPIPSMIANTRIATIKEEPQTVPCLGMTPPLSPINMETQEVIKLERKRARNRVAARKCRTRKLEKISRLEERVDEIKGMNTELSQTATILRDQVMQLKKQIMDHVNSGCQVILTTDSNLS